MNSLKTVGRTNPYIHFLYGHIKISNTPKEKFQDQKNDLINENKQIKNQRFFNQTQNSKEMPIINPKNAGLKVPWSINDKNFLLNILACQSLNNLKIEYMK